MHQKFSGVLLLVLFRLVVGVPYLEYHDLLPPMIKDSVESVLEKLFNPCNINDIKCLNVANQNFLEKSANGLPDLDIKATDPLIIPDLKLVVDDDMGLAFDFTNINVTGLKNQQISDLQMDTDNKSVVLKMKAVLNIAAALVSSQYGYSLTKKGAADYFELAPETNTCEIIGEPVVTIDDILQNALDNDSDEKSKKPEYDTIKDSLKKKTICTIVETAYITVIHNLRTLAKVFPASTFFNDI